MTHRPPLAATASIPATWYPEPAPIPLAPFVPIGPAAVTNSSSHGVFRSVSELSDSAIIERVLAGEGEVYAVLVRRYRVRFARYAVHMLGNREDAEEALQDAFVRAWRALGRCRDRDRFDAWLFQILANRCRTRGARRQRYEATFVPDEGVVTAAADEAPHAAPDEPGWSDGVAQALTVLEPDQREAFLLKYVEELSYDEIAALTGVGVSALKMRVKRAADRLRQLLEERANVVQ